eukprot:m.201495 g.201495  ORF g.201495 m.201495 type:complete len:119 (+) comp53829_c1_seq2:158-514(+)
MPTPAMCSCRSQKDSWASSDAKEDARLAESSLASNACKEFWRSRQKQPQTQANANGSLRKLTSPTPILLYQVRWRSSGSQRDCTKMTAGHAEVSINLRIMWGNRLHGALIQLFSPDHS